MIEDPRPIGVLRRLVASGVPGIGDQSHDVLCVRLVFRSSRRIVNESYLHFFVITGEAVDGLWNN